MLGEVDMYLVLTVLITDRSVKTEAWDGAHAQIISNNVQHGGHLREDEHLEERGMRKNTVVLISFSLRMGWAEAT